MKTDFRAVTTHQIRKTNSPKTMGNQLPSQPVIFAPVTKKIRGRALGPTPNPLPNYRSM